MRFGRRIWAAVLATVLAGAACGGGPASEETVPSTEAPEIVILATTSIMGDIARNVAGERARVDVMMPVGADPHDFVPSAEAVNSIYRAQLVVSTGFLLEEGMADVLDIARSEGVNLFEMGEAVLGADGGNGAGQDQPEQEGDSHDHDEDGDSHDEDEAGSHDHDEDEASHDDEDGEDHGEEGAGSHDHDEDDHDEDGEDHGEDEAGSHDHDDGDDHDEDEAAHEGDGDGHDEDGDDHGEDEAGSHDHDEDEASHEDEAGSHDHDDGDDHDEDGDAHDEDGDGHDEDGDAHDEDEAGSHDHDEDETSHEDEAGSHDHDEDEASHDDEAGSHDHEEEGDSHDHGHDHGGLDPHFWMDPLLVAEGALALGEQLTPFDGSGEWMAGAQAYADQLAALDEEIREILSVVPSERRKLITNHDAFGYFAQRYGLEILATVIPSTSTLAEPGSAHLAGLVEIITEQGIPAIFVENIVSSDIAESLAAEVGFEVRVVELYTGSLGEEGSGAETLIAMLRTNAQRIAEALA